MNTSYTDNNPDWSKELFALDPTEYLLNIKVLTLVTMCWSLHGHAHDTLVYVESAYTGKPRISGSRYLGEAGVNLLLQGTTPVRPSSQL